MESFSFSSIGQNYIFNTWQIYWGSVKVRRWSFPEDYAIVSTKVYSLARELEKFHVDAVPELQMNNKVQFQHAMEVLPKIGANYVLVICRPENLATVLEKVCLISCSKVWSLFVIASSHWRLSKTIIIQLRFTLFWVIDWCIFPGVLRLLFA